MRPAAPAALLAAAAGALAQPANDNCSSATPISGFQSIIYNNALATTDGVPNAACASVSGTGIDRDVWYCWTAPQSGRVWITTCELSSLNTKLAVYDGCSCPEGSAILGCNDDGCADGRSYVSWNAQAGQPYLLRVGVAPGSPGGSSRFDLHPLPPRIIWPIHNPGNGHQYVLFAPSSWETAQAAIQNNTSGRLNFTSIRSAAENEFIRASVLRFDQQDRRGWIGLRDATGSGAFAWVRGDALGYTNWAPGEPDNTGVERWAEMSSTSGQWLSSVNDPAGDVYAVAETPPECYADCNGDRVLNVNDFICFQSIFPCGCTYPDCNRDQMINVNDFICFQQRFAAGCSAL